MGFVGGSWYQALVETIKILVPILKVACLCNGDGNVLVGLHRFNQLFEAVNIVAAVTS